MILRDRLGLLAAVIPSVVLSASSSAYAADGVITGQVRNAATKAPIPDVVITVTSPLLQGEQIVLTDAGGNFRVPQIPPGEGYSVSADGGTQYKPSARGGIKLTSGSTVRVNIELLPENAGVIEQVVEARAPVVDVGSSRIATTIDQEMMRRLAVNAPSGKGGASRSFESLAQIAPGANSDQYGTSINGTTSPENAFIIGFSIGGPILKNKLWFYAGFQVALTRMNLDRSLNKLEFTTDPMTGAPLDPIIARTRTERRSPISHTTASSIAPTVQSTSRYSKRRRRRRRSAGLSRIAGTFSTALR